MTHGKPHRERPHKPHELGPRIFFRGRWAGADLRPWGGSRVTLRDPDHPRWPKGGERTEDPKVAIRWAWRYATALQQAGSRKALGGREAERLDDAVRRYLRHREHPVEDATLRNDKTVTTHLVEWVGGDRDVADIAREDVQGLFDDLRRSDYASTTLDTYQRVLHRFFAWLGVKGNPAKGLDLPTPARQDIRPWSDAEMDTLREAADRLDSQDKSGLRRYRLGLEAVVNTGGRAMELAALEWRDFQPEHKTVRFVRQLDRATNKPRPLKGKNAGTALVLQEWWDFHDEGATGRVLLNAKGGPMTSPVSRAMIVRLLDTAGLNERGAGWHRGRHTYARLFIERGGRLEELQKSLRHKSILTTEREYGHLHEDVAAKLARMRIYKDEPIRRIK